MTKILSTFLTTLVLGYFLFQEVGLRQYKKELSRDQIEVDIIQQEMMDRFDLFLEIPFSMGNTIAGYLAMTPKEGPDNYGKLVDAILGFRQDIRGLNLVSTEGVIIRAYPLETNQKAFGKKSQNFNELLASYNRGEKCWFSPPFKLYQGETGFAFYVPIVKDNILQGWIAAVISSERFFDNFRNLNFFKTYELSIKDKATGTPFFETAITPENTPILNSKGHIAGRTLTFESWRKFDKQNSGLEWYWSLGLASILATLSAIGMLLYLQKKKSTDQLANIEKILHLTSKEGLAKLVDIQSDYIKQGSTGYLKTEIVEKDIHSITNLLEQIDLLQSMAASDDQGIENVEITGLIKDQVQDLQDISQKIGVNFKGNLDALIGKVFKGNIWILSNCVFKNILAHCLLHAQHNSIICISGEEVSKGAVIHFQVPDMHNMSMSAEHKLERKFMVAKNAAEIYGGTLEMTNDEFGGLAIKLNLKS